MRRDGLRGGRQKQRGAFQLDRRSSRDRKTKQREGDRKSRLSFLNKTTGSGQSCSARLAGAGVCTKSCREPRIKLVPAPGSLPLTNKPHNGTLLGSKWEHSFSLLQVYLSPHALTLQCRGVLRWRIRGERKDKNKKKKKSGRTGERSWLIRHRGLSLFFSLKAAPLPIFVLITGWKSIISFFGSGRWYLC